MSKHLFEGQYLAVVDLGEGLVEVRLDRQGEAVNTLDGHFTSELAQVVENLAAQSGLRGVLLSSAKAAFLAGADLNVLLQLCERPTAERIAFSFDNGGVMTTLEDLPVPIVAAINGYALGGGLEVALCADYRVLAADGMIGLPEVGFGILPGWGGTVRLPRLSSLAVALDWIVGAKPQKPPKALEDGVVDALAEPAVLRETALQWLRRASSGELDWKARRRKRQGPFAADDAALAAARDKAKKAGRFYPAAPAVIDLLERCAPLDRNAALLQEAETFAMLAGTPTARALVGVFLSNQQIRKTSKSLAKQGRPVRRGAVLGAGIMGGGIAYTSAISKIPVLLKDIAQPALDLGMAEARKLLSKPVESGRMQAAQAEAILASIEPQLEFAQFDTVDVVVEAVIENLNVKREVLAQVEALVKPGTVLASNTSSLSIAEIAETLQRPQDVVGMHFFNPVHLMPLVEVIRGPATSDHAVVTAVGYVTAMNKTPLVVKDCPGFLVNRLLGAYFSAFNHLLHDGADFVQIDRVMESWGWPMGPAYLMDVAGIDTLDKAMAILAQAYPGVMSAPFHTAIQLLAGEKRYGQKTAAGFYRYEADTKGRPRRSNDPGIYDLLGRAQPQGRRSFDDQEIEERLMLAMILEAVRCLHQQVVASAVEIDAGMRLGTGFPAHHGGPLWYADSIGLEEVLQRCERYAALGALYTLDSATAAFMRQSTRFYSHAAATP